MTLVTCTTFSRQPYLPLLLLAAALPTLAVSADAQAGTTASRSADISLFAGAQIAHPAYGTGDAGGVAFGLDYTRFFPHLPVQPSLELRLNTNRNTLVHEDSYLVGLRAAHPFGRVVPYVDFLIGAGTIHFPQNVFYTSDNSVVPSYGGGIDLTVTRNFDLKLDLQGQHWNTGDHKFTPTLGTVGVVYHIPFRRQYGQ